MGVLRLSFRILGGLLTESGNFEIWCIFVRLFVILIVNRGWYGGGPRIILFLSLVFDLGFGKFIWLKGICKGTTC